MHTANYHWCHCQVPPRLGRLTHLAPVTEAGVVGRAGHSSPLREGSSSFPAVPVTAAQAHTGILSPFNQHPQSTTQPKCGRSPRCYAEEGGMLPDFSFNPG